MIRPVLDEGDAPAARAAICLVSGIFFGAWSVRGLPSAVALVAVSGAGLAALPRGRCRGPVFRLAFVAFWSGTGFAVARGCIAIPARDAASRFACLDTARLSVDQLEGTLADFWSGEPPRARTTLHAERLNAGQGWTPFRAEVVVFVSGQSPVSGAADRGDRVRLTGRLEPEDLPASDREIPLPWPRYRMSVKSARLMDRVGSTASTLLTLPNRWLFKALALQGAGDPEFDRNVRGPLAALLLGRTSELDRGMVARYRRGGLYHLLVVSGLHVVLAVTLVVPVLALFGIRGKPRDCFLLAAVFLFVLIGGGNPPAVRAGLVVAILLATRLCERPVTAAQAIGLSALILFLASPAQIFSIGTILTFAAACGIALFSKPILAVLPRRPRWLFSSLAVALAAECATAPVLFWRFNLVAAGAWLTAPISIPLAGGLIGLGGVLLLFYAAGIPAAPLAALFGFGSRILEQLADRAAGLAFLRPTPPLWAMLAVGGLLLTVAFCSGRLRRGAAVGAASLYLVMAVRPGPRGPARGFSVEALDVGQGDAILLRWKEKAILVDGGGPFDAASTDFGRTRLVPKLLDRGVTHLDTVILTHPHPDHGLGLFAVLEELPVVLFAHSSGEDEGELYARLDHVARERGVPVRVLSSPDTLEWPDARLSVLHSGGRARKTDTVNNQSVVTLFERDGRSALLTGDAGMPTEADLLAAEALPRIDLLKVGHHGSRTSTSAALLERLRPRVALLSCGRRNRFGHPAGQTLETLARFCVPVFRTDLRSDCLVELVPGATRLSWRGVERP